MSQFHRPTVSLLCLSEEHSDRHMSQSVAIALAEIGWQVHLFVRARILEAIPASWVAPHCQVVKLAMTASVEDIAKKIAAAQHKVGLVWPLLHSFDDLGAQVGAFVKTAWGWRWLHTPAITSQETDKTADQLILLTPTLGSARDLPADEIVQLRRQRQRLTQATSDENWIGVAHRLDFLYRQNLALHIGATAIHLQKEVSIPLPVFISEYDRVPAVQLA